MKNNFKFTNEDMNSARNEKHDIPPHVIACLTRDLPSWNRDILGQLVMLNLFQHLSHDKISRQSHKEKKNITQNKICSNTRKKGELMFKQTQKLTTKTAFTLAETLIALAVIGIVAALTIPGIVKNYNEHAWSTGKDVFTKRLDVALKEMNTDGTLTGYKTTAEFVNELKKNIKITQICTDDVTKCFAKNVKVRQYNGEVTLTNDNAIECETNAGQDWAENVGIRFANGVNAIISYNKNCTSDPYNNQFLPSPACIGIIYDVSGNKKPNASGKDIGANANVAKAGGKSLCAFEFKYKDNEPICFTKILAPNEYEPLSNTKCTELQTVLGLNGACYDNDYFAGAAYMCGGKTKMASQDQLTLLAKYLYNTDSLPTSASNDEKILTDRLGPFKSYYDSNTHYIEPTDSYQNYFRAWVAKEGYGRSFYASYTNYNSYYGRSFTEVSAVCVE